MYTYMHTIVMHALELVYAMVTRISKLGACLRPFGYRFVCNTTAHTGSIRSNIVRKGC